MTATVASPKSKHQSGVGPNKGFTAHNHVAGARTQEASVRAASPAESFFLRQSPSFSRALVG